MTSQLEQPQLILTIDAGPAAAERLTAALQSSRVACVVVRSGGAGAELAPLVAAARGNGAVALLLDDAALALRVGADGVHLSPGDDIIERLGSARALLGKAGIVGFDAGASRHNAMEAGEAGADYVAFGLATTGNAPEAIEQQLDFVSWWAEVFEVPCVGLSVTSEDHAAALADCGADFVAIDIGAGLSPADARELVDRCAAAVAHRVGAVQ